MCEMCHHESTLGMVTRPLNLVWNVQQLMETRESSASLLGKRMSERRRAWSTDPPRFNSARRGGQDIKHVHKRMRNDVCLGYFVRDVIDFDNARCLSTLQRNRVEHYRKNGREAERDGGRIHTYCLLIAEAAGS
jgi:hypothetical protein